MRPFYELTVRDIEKLEENDFVDCRASNLQSEKCLIFSIWLAVKPQNDLDKKPYTDRKCVAAIYYFL